MIHLAIQASRPRIGILKNTSVCCDTAYRNVCLMRMLGTMLKEIYNIRVIHTSNMLTHQDTPLCYSSICIIAPVKAISPHFVGCSGPGRLDHLQSCLHFGGHSSGCCSWVLTIICSMTPCGIAVGMLPDALGEAFGTILAPNGPQHKKTWKDSSLLVTPGNFSGTLLANCFAHRRLKVQHLRLCWCHYQSSILCWNLDGRTFKRHDVYTLSAAFSET